MKTIRQIAFCPHCGNKASQRLIHSQHYDGQGFFFDGTPVPGEIPSVCFVAECETCKKILLYGAEIEIPKNEFFANAHLIWPDAGTLHPSVPKKIGEYYQEASRIKNLAPNAFAVQIRRSLEALCDDRGAKKGSLHNRLKALSNDGEIPSVLAEMTDVLRLIGNIGAHASEESVMPGHVQVIDDFFRAIVEYVYVAPSKIKTFRENLPLIKKLRDKSNSN